MGVLKDKLAAKFQFNGTFAAYVAARPLELKHSNIAALRRAYLRDSTRVLTYENIFRGHYSPYIEEVIAQRSTIFENLLDTDSAWG
jgi:hypothetical protein